MWKLMTVVLLFGFMSAASGADDKNNDRDKRQRGIEGQHTIRTNTPTGPAVPSVVRPGNFQPSVIGVSNEGRGRERETRTRIVVPSQPTVSGAANFNRAREREDRRRAVIPAQPVDSGTAHFRGRERGHSNQIFIPSTVQSDRHRTVVRSSDSRHQQSNRDRHHRGSNVNVFFGTNAAYYPYYNYNYPNRYFICYEEDRVEESRYHISCPYPTAWYNTNPAYSTFQYQSSYRPEYICPNYGASQYIEFASSYAATTWWNQNCNSWHYIQPIIDSSDDFISNDEE